MISEMEIQQLVKRDRIIIIGLLALLAVIAWGYMLYMAPPGASMMMEGAGACTMQWGATDIIMSFVMWAVMMVAMMIPAATPMILMFTAINREQKQQSASLVDTTSFIAGYLIVWTAYSVLATLVQWGLHTAALLSHSMAISNPFLGGSLLLMAGIFQWTPVRDACMKKCRSPLGFILSEWREGRSGAAVMGLRHGLYCVGCCWLLMALGLVLGVMNLWWMAALTVFMVVEKAFTDGLWLTRGAGLLFAAWGLAVMA